MLAEQLLPVQAPLNLVGLQGVPVLGHDAELVPQPSEIGGHASELGLATGGLLFGGRQALSGPAKVALGDLTRLPGLVAIGGHLVALLFDEVDGLAQVRQGGIEGLDLGAQLFRLGIDRLPFTGPAAARLLVTGQLGREALGERFDAREELPPMVDGLAERARQVRRVRHAPITPTGGMAGTSATFGPGRRFGPSRR